jgi:2-dehydropantoate 2-reductase
MTSTLTRDTGRTLIWGAGAVGGTVGAYLVRAGEDVTFVDTVVPHVEAIADAGRGLQISGPVDEFRISAPAMVPELVVGTWKRIFLAVKAHHTEDACKALLPHLAPDGCLVSLQNGLCEAMVADIVGADRTVGAFINMGADWLAPGEILYSNRGALVLGELDGIVSTRVEELLALLKRFEPSARITRHIWGHLWGKLAYASLLFAQAVGNLGIADCLARPELFPLWRQLAGEVVRTARAEGVDARGSDGFVPAAFAPGGTEDQARDSIVAMVAFNRPNAKTHSGVWRDLAIRRRPTEVDAQLGLVVRRAERHALPRPALTALIDMIHEIEAGDRPVSDENLMELVAVCGCDSMAASSR